nr:reverse transcriptase domain-containing protein [Tanacetum cinerariifolium]
MATLTDMMTKLVSANTTSSSGSGTFPGNTVTNPKKELKGITTRSGVAYQGPKTPSPSKQGTKVTKDQVETPSSQNTAPVQPSFIQSESQALVFEPVVAPVSAPMPNLKPFIPYPSRHDNEKRRDQANEQIEKFYEIFKEMSFEISFTDALILMPKFASTLKALIRNKEKLSEMARTTMNEHCSAVILNKLPRKLGDPGKILIPCEFSGMDECLALADLGASINLMPLSVWERLSLPELTPTCMTLELADRSVSTPIGIAKDVSYKVGVFHIPADFVVVDFEPDPRVPLILGRCFLKTSRALIDVHKGELTLRIRNEAITYNLDQTVRYFANFNQMAENKIDVVESACEEYSQELHQLDTFYNALNINDQDSLNSSAGGNVLDKMPRECLKIIESKSKVRQSRAKTVVAEVGTSSSTPIISSDVAELKDMVKALLLDKKNQSPAPTPSTTPAPVKAVEPNFSKPIGIAKDVSFKVGVFRFPSDFVVVDFEPDPRVPLILERFFLKTSRALIDIHKGELTLRIGNEAITYNLDRTVRYSANYNQMTANKIDVIESVYEEYSQEVLGFSNVTTSGTPT